MSEGSEIHGDVSPSGMLLGVKEPRRASGRLSSDAARTEDLEIRPGGYLVWLLGALGLGGLIASMATRPSDAEAAASQDWPPFVLVTGLLLIGLVADDDGLFAAAGHQLARVARCGGVLFLGATVLIGVVSAAVVRSGNIRPKGHCGEVGNVAP
jgi:hypothetical protein